MGYRGIPDSQLKHCSLPLPLCGERSGTKWLPCITQGALVVVEASFPLVTVKRFECLEKRFMNVMIYQWKQGNYTVQWEKVDLYQSLQESPSSKTGKIWLQDIDRNESMRSTYFSKSTLSQHSVMSEGVFGYRLPVRHRVREH